MIALDSALHCQHVRVWLDRKYIGFRVQMVFTCNTLVSFERTAVGFSFCQLYTLVGVRVPLSLPFEFTCTAFLNDLPKVVCCLGKAAFVEVLVKSHKFDVRLRFLYCVLLGLCVKSGGTH